MTTFNPFRAALAYLNTPHDLDRGGIDLKVRNSFVCFSIERASANLVHDEQQLCVKAVAYIDSIIRHKGNEDSPTVTKWLRTNCPEYRKMEAKPGNHSLKYDLLQAYRWRWLNHMADQFDAGVIKLS